MYCSDFFLFFFLLNQCKTLFKNFLKTTDFLVKREKFLPSRINKKDLMKKVVCEKKVII